MICNYDIKRNIYIQSNYSEVIIIYVNYNDAVMHHEIVETCSKSLEVRHMYWCMI